MARGPDRGMRKSGAQCFGCGITAGNLSGIPVHRYPLRRSVYEDGRQRTINVASIGVCDTCVEENAHPTRDYSARNTARRHRHLRSRSDPSDVEIHQHAGYEPGHRHPELGPALRLLQPQDLSA